MSEPDDTPVERVETPPLLRIVKGDPTPEEVEARRAELVTEYEDTLANPYVAAERGYVDAVISPHETRTEIVRALRLLATKRETLPPKKHGNIPL